MKKIENYSYKNGELFKFKNTRVQVVSLPAEEYGIEFTVLSKDTSPRTTHIVKKNKVVTTVMRMSTEAAISLMTGIQKQLHKDGII